MAITLPTLCSLLVLSLACLPPAAAPAVPANGPAPSVTLDDPNTVLNSPSFDASDASSWTQLFTNWATRMNKVYPSLAAEQEA